MISTLLQYKNAESAEIPESSESEVGSPPMEEEDLLAAHRGATKLKVLHISSRLTVLCFQKLRASTVSS